MSEKDKWNSSNTPKCVNNTPKKERDRERRREIEILGVLLTHSGVDNTQKISSMICSFLRCWVWGSENHCISDAKNLLAFCIWIPDSAYCR
jgi:hypothetical protein